VAFSKPLSLVWLLLVAYRIFLMGRFTAGLSEDLAVLAAAGVLLYAALNVFVLWSPITSYRVAPISGTLYHNTTQQASLAVGLAGLYLAVQALRHRGGLFTPGCLLVAGSLFFKPSLFTVAAPALGLVAALRSREGWRRDELFGIGVIAGLATLWFFAYPRLLHLPVVSTPLKLAFLPWHHGHAPEQIAWSVKSSLVLTLSVSGLSYAGFVVPMLALATTRQSISQWRHAALRRPDIVALILVFALGLVSGLFFLEDNARRNHGNLMWGYAVGHFVLLPFVVLGISRITHTVVRRLGWTVYTAHLVSGAWNLLLFAYGGVI
jgi:hypothetical protein